MWSEKRMGYHAWVFPPKFRTNPLIWAEKQGWMYHFRRKIGQKKQRNGLVQWRMGYHAWVFPHKYRPNTADMGGKFRPKSPFCLAGEWEKSMGWSRCSMSRRLSTAFIAIHNYLLRLLIIISPIPSLTHQGQGRQFSHLIPEIWGYAV